MIVRSTDQVNFHLELKKHLRKLRKIEEGLAAIKDTFPTEVLSLKDRFLSSLSTVISQTSNYVNLYMQVV